MLEYIVLQNGSLGGLVAEVTKAIAQKWRPQGGICVAHESVGSTQFPNHYAFRLLYLQAMVREENKDTLSDDLHIGGAHSAPNDLLSTGTPIDYGTTTYTPDGTPIASGSTTFISAGTLVSETSNE
jgi:hypothetical protein